MTSQKNSRSFRHRQLAHEFNVHRGLSSEVIDGLLSHMLLLEDKIASLQQELDDKNDKENMSADQWTDQKWS